MVWPGPQTVGPAAALVAAARCRSCERQPLKLKPENADRSRPRKIGGGCSSSCSFEAFRNQLRPLGLQILARLSAYPKQIDDSGLLQERSPNRRRHFNRNESIGGEQVIFSALVDHSEIAVAFSVFVGQDRIDLVALQRRLIAVVANADSKPARVCGGLAPSRGTACA
jgi:hypothetical protein